MRHTTVLAVLSMIFMLVDDIFPFIEREKNRGKLAVQRQLPAVGWRYFAQRRCRGHISSKIIPLSCSLPPKRLHDLFSINILY
jgi:hypothetical protein